MITDKSLKYRIFAGLLVFILFMPFVGGNIDPQKDNNDKSNNRHLKEFYIEAFRYGYDPGVITVNKGDRVRLKIKSIQGVHGFALYSPGLYNINKQLRPGNTVTVEFDANKTGTFYFYCSNACGRGHDKMVGKLVVKDSKDENVGNDKVKAGDNPDSIKSEEEIVITILDSAYHPSKLHLVKGEKVKLRIINKDKVTHGFGSMELGVQKRIKAGEELVLEILPKDLGSFPFYCVADCGSNHFSMKGEVIVSEKSGILDEEVGENMTNISGDKSSSSKTGTENSIRIRNKTPIKMEFNLFIALILIISGIVLSGGSMFCYTLYSKYSKKKRERERGKLKTVEKG